MSSIIASTEFPKALKASRKALNLPPSGMVLGSLFPWICWNIWIARNYKTFEKRNFDAKETLSKAIVDAREWQAAQLEHVTPKHIGQQPSSPPPPHATRTPRSHHRSYRCSLEGNRKESGVGLDFLGPYRESLDQRSCNRTLRFLPTGGRGYGDKGSATTSTFFQVQKTTHQIRQLRQSSEWERAFWYPPGYPQPVLYLSVSCFCFIPHLDNIAADTLAKKALATTMVM